MTQHTAQINCTVLNKHCACSNKQGRGGTDQFLLIFRTAVG